MLTLVSRAIISNTTLTPLVFLVAPCVLLHLADLGGARCGSRRRRAGRLGSPVAAARTTPRCGTSTASAAPRQQWMRSATRKGPKKPGKQPETSGGLSQLRCQWTHAPTCTIPTSAGASEGSSLSGTAIGKGTPKNDLMLAASLGPRRRAVLGNRAWGPTRLIRCMAREVQAHRDRTVLRVIVFFFAGIAMGRSYPLRGSPAGTMAPAAAAGKLGRMPRR